MFAFSSVQQIWSSKRKDKQPPTASGGTLKIRFIPLHLLLSKVTFINLHVQIHHRGLQQFQKLRSSEVLKKARLTVFHPGRCS